MRFDFATTNIETPEKQLAVDVIFNIEGDENYSTPRKAIMENKIYFVHTLVGSGTINFDNTTILCSSNEFMFIKPTSDFSYKTTKNVWHFWWFEFIMPTEDTSLKFEPNKIYQSPHNKLVESLCEKALMYAKFDSWEICSTLFKSICAMLLYETFSGVKTAHYEKRMATIVRYIDENIKTVNVRELCVAFNTEERTLRNLFHKTLGYSPKQYIDKMKLNGASQLLLSTHYNLEEIAQMLGYSSQYHLSKAFTAQFGISPIKYRKHITI